MPSSPTRSAAAARSTCARGARRPRRRGRADGPAPFINPAVIHRTAALSAAERGVAMEPFRYREGIALDGSPFTLPFRLGAAGALAGTQVGIRALTRARPAVRARVAKALHSALPSSGFGPAPDRLEPWRCASTSTRGPPAPTGSASRSRRVASRLSGDRADARRSRADARGGRRDARPRRLPDPGAGLGTGALDRFDRAKMTFTVTEGAAIAAETRV